MRLQRVVGRMLAFLAAVLLIVAGWSAIGQIWDAAAWALFFMGIAIVGALVITPQDDMFFHL